jgi:hypothetical protein
MSMIRTATAFRPARLVSTSPMAALRFSSLPAHSNAVKITERFRRINFGRMELAITVDDPKAYPKPWTVTTALQVRPDVELIESFCDGHDKTMEHRRIDPAPAEPPSPPHEEVIDVRRSARASTSRL